MRRRAPSSGRPHRPSGKDPATRTLVVCSIVSLDGFAAGPGGDFSVLPLDEGFNRSCAERLRAADTVLAGRTTFELFHGFWPAVADDPHASDAEREISGRNNAARHVVVSDTLVVDDGPWAASTTVVPRDAAHAAVTDLLAEGGGEVVVFGSGTTWNDLLGAGLVGELHLLAGPQLLGAGVPVFTGPPTPLRLLEVRPLEDSALVLHRYGV